MMQVDVAIAGGSSAGMLLAGLLAKNGFSVAVVEEAVIAGEVSAEFDLRTVALTRASENLLAAVGARAELQSMRHCAYADMEVWEADGTGLVHFSAQEVAESHLGLLVENAVLNAALVRATRKQEGIRWIEARVTGFSETAEGVRLALSNGEEWLAGMLVGADGAQSFVRKRADIVLDARDYHQKAIVLTARCEKSHDMTAWQRFLPTGPLAFLPLMDDEGGRQHCSIVWSQNEAEADRLLALDDDAFRRELGMAFEHRLGQVEWVSRRAAFPLVARHAARYSSGRVVLVGDAAHTIHPLAGQGLNLGVLDIGVLVEEMQQARQRGLPFWSETVLRRYERRRRGPNLLMQKSMTGFERLFAADALPVRYARNAGMRLVNRVGPVKGMIIRSAMGLTGDLPSAARAAV